MSHKYLVNGATLGDKINEFVCITVKVTSVEPSGTSIFAETTDDRQVKILLNEPLTAPLTGWIEVLGVPSSSGQIKCREIITLKDTEDFDKESHNMAVLLWNNCKDLYQFE